MNDEIKEILAYFEEYVKITDMHDSEPMLNWKDLKIVLDYITNLQQKVEQYENPDDLTLFYMWLDEKAKDKMKELRQENEKLKELCDKYEEEHNTAFKLWKMKMEEIPTYEEKEDYKSRIDKAIKLIESYNLGKYDYTISPGGIIEVLDILKGDSNE